MGEELARFKRHLKTQGLSDGSQHAYTTIVRAFLRGGPPTPGRAQDFMGKVSAKSWFLYHAALKHLDNSRKKMRYLPLLEDMKCPRRPKRVPRALTREQIEKMLGARASTYLLTLRNRTMVGLAYACGLRRAEIADLKPGDIDVEHRRIIVRGKGDRERALPVASRYWGLLIRYVQKTYRLRLRSPKRFTTLFAVRKAGVYRALKQMASAAGIEDFHPHLLRASYASHMLVGGMPLNFISELMGHGSLATTADYLAGDPILREKLYHQCFGKNTGGE